MSPLNPLQSPLQDWPKLLQLYPWAVVGTQDQPLGSPSACPQSYTRLMALAALGRGPLPPAQVYLVG